MAKYVLVYYGAGVPETEAEQAAAKKAWGDWLGGLGPAIADAGNPFGAVASVTPGGSGDGPVGERASGYSIVNADGLSAATEMARGCPVLTGGGSAAVYETIDVM